MVRQVQIGLGKARRDMAWQAWSGVDWRAEAGHGKVRYGTAGGACSGMLRNGRP